jgi:hypothetical protein
VSVARVGLNAEEREVEERAIQLLKSKSEKLIAVYRERFGSVIGTDLARELFPDYSKSLESRLKYAVAVQKSASALAELVFDAFLAEKIGSAVLFTAGGTGAGKTASIMRNAETYGTVNDAGLVFDGNFNSWSSSRDRVLKCLEFGYKVVIIFVHRHPVEAYLQGVIPRALLEGRTVAIESHLRMHGDSISTFLRVARHFRDNKNVSCVVLNNTGHELESYLTDVDYLKGVKYDLDALRKSLQEELDYAFAQGNISKALYAASRGTQRA